MHNSGAHGKLQGIAADLGTADGTRCVIERLPQLDILVNNLGIYEPKPFEQISDDDWQRFFEVNVLSGVRRKPALSAWHERTQLGTHCIHLQRERGSDSH